MTDKVQEKKPTLYVSGMCVGAKKAGMMQYKRIESDDIYELLEMVAIRIISTFTTDPDQKRRAMCYLGIQLIGRTIDPNITDEGWEELKEEIENEVRKHKG